MTKIWTPTAHPVLELPTAEEALAMGSIEFQKWFGRGGKRETIIAKEKADPFGCGWEPPIWLVCDCLLGFPWVDPELADRMRRRLGWKKPVDVLLINGGQRGAKTTYGIKRLMKVLRGGPERNAWCFHSSDDMSIQWHQTQAYKFLPPPLQKKIQSATTYIAFKRQTGFSDRKFVLPNLSSCHFRTYGQDEGTLEGANLDYVFCDELVPADVVETLQLRIAERQGKMVIGFTPVDGYTETVRAFQDGAQVMRQSIAYLCPKDGGPWDLAAALGLSPAELEELEAAQEQKRTGFSPWSRPEPCLNWLEEEEPRQLARTEGRVFKRVPRVLKCVDPEEKRAVVFFHSSDNPYGNPRSVFARIARRGEAFIEERFYGIANKKFSARFPKFNLKVHVIDPRDIPKEGTNYQFIDPASGRNYFCGWFRVCPNGVYLYREWPGNYAIEGVGIPGPWALPDGKLPDGKMGPAQTPFGFGYARYKLEFARLEGWKDYKAANAEGRGSKKLEEWVHPWDEANGADEVIHERFMDSRFASAAREQGDQPETALTRFDDLGLHFKPTPGDPILEGIQDINDALDYDETRAVDDFNRPFLRISADCVNTIYALQTWTGLDGSTLAAGSRISQKAATKDPIDVLRYFFRAKCGYVEPGLSGKYRGGGY